MFLQLFTKVFMSGSKGYSPKNKTFKVFSDFFFFYKQPKKIYISKGEKVFLFCFLASNPYKQ